MEQTLRIYAAVAEMADAPGSSSGAFGLESSTLSSGIMKKLIWIVGILFITGCLATDPCASQPGDLLHLTAPFGQTYNALDGCFVY